MNNPRHISMDNNDKYDIDVVIAVPDKSAIVPAYLAYYTNSPIGRSIVKETNAELHKAI